MVSILNRIRACVFLRAVAVVSAFLLVLGSVAPNVIAHAPKPHEDAGDGETVGGYRDAERSPGKAADDPPAVSPWTEGQIIYFVNISRVDWYWFTGFIKRM
jgi:hypothetical protein